MTYAEPAFAQVLDWWLCAALADLSEPAGGSTYLRLSTRPIDQAPFVSARNGSASSASATTSSPAATGCASRTMERRLSSW